MFFDVYPIFKINILFIYIGSRGAEKYFRRGSRLNWPEGAVSRESIRAVKKLDFLQVFAFLSILLGVVNIDLLISADGNFAWFC